jgi:small subunit ribosomal protein S6
MPRYEVGYILSSAVADDEVTKVAAEITKIVETVGGKILNEDHWGRKKLAYPIGRTRNGYYAFISADIESSKVQEIEHQLNTHDAVIRFIIVNMVDADKRMAKDEALRASRPQRVGAESTEGVVGAEGKSEAVAPTVPDAKPEPAPEQETKEVVEAKDKA